MSHDEFTGLAAGYALSALDPDELKSFETHLASCPECAAGVAGMRPAVDALSMMNEERQPVEELRERILASARVEAAGQAGPAEMAPWWRRPVLWPLPVAAVIAALAVAIAVVSIWGYQDDDDFASVSLADDRLASVQRQLNLSYEGIEIMAQADQWWRFDGSGVNSAAVGTLAYSVEFGAACLLILGLAEGDQSVYQSRLTEADGQVSMHRMWRYNNAMWLVLKGDPNRLKRFEIVLVPGGSLSASEIPALIDIPLKSS